MEEGHPFRGETFGWGSGWGGPRPRATKSSGHYFSYHENNKTLYTEQDILMGAGNPIRRNLFGQDLAMHTMEGHITKTTWRP